WNLINPVYHATSPVEVERYKVEPYVVCADVYGASPHTGRGGWTWYTGSASWLYRVGLEAMLGFRLKGGTLHFEPCIPKSCQTYEITYRYGSATYRIHVENKPRGAGVQSIKVDGKQTSRVSLEDDEKIHDVRVELS